MLPPSFNFQDPQIRGIAVAFLSVDIGLTPDSKSIELAEKISVHFDELLATSTKFLGRVFAKVNSQKSWQLMRIDIEPHPGIGYAWHGYLLWFKIESDPEAEYCLHYGTIPFNPKRSPNSFFRAVPVVSVSHVIASIAKHPAALDWTKLKYQDGSWSFELPAPHYVSILVAGDIDGPNQEHLAAANFVVSHLDPLLSRAKEWLNISFRDWETETRWCPESIWFGMDPYEFSESNRLPYAFAISFYYEDGANNGISMALYYQIDQPVDEKIDQRNQDWMTPWKQYRFC